MSPRSSAVAVRVVLLAIGVAAGSVGTFFYGQFRFLNASATNIYLSRELTDAKASFTLMRTLAAGHLDTAFMEAETRVIGPFITMHFFPGATNEARAATREYITQVSAFYKAHPDRRAALAKLYSGQTDLLEWIDSGT